MVAGETVAIEWEILQNHQQLNWDLQYTLDGGTNWDTLAMNLDVSQLTYTWTAPAIFTELAQIRVAQDNTTTDYYATSDYFRIQLEPLNVDDDAPQPAGFYLGPNYPNPFNPATTITYSLDKSGPIELLIFDLLGRTVRTLVHGAQTSGLHSVVWAGLDDAGRQLPTGLYFYRLTKLAAGTSPVSTRVGRMILLK